MMYGVLVHKIPIAILITSFLVQSKFTKFQIIGFITFFALMTPLGTIISNNLDIPEPITFIISAVAIGIFLHISTTIIFESSEGHKFNLSKLIVIILGIAIAYII